MKITYIIILLTLLQINLTQAKGNVTDLIDENELICVKKSYQTLMSKGYKQAMIIANSCGINAVKDMINWQAIMSNKITNIDTTLEFFNNSPHYPRQKQLITKIEDSALLKEADNKLLVGFLEDHALNIRNSYQILLDNINSSANLNKTDQINLMKKYLLSNNCKIKDFIYFIKKDKINFLKRKFVRKKIENLLWAGKYYDVKKLFPYISKEYKNLYKAQIAFIKNYSNAPQYLANVSKDLHYQELLIYNIVRWLEKRDQDSKITAYLTKIKNSAYPSKWFSVKIRNARFLVKTKQYKQAYEIVNNNLEKGDYQYAETQWFAGWVALRFLSKPKIAISHFENLYNNVNFSVSLARGAYWLGRSYDAMNNQDDAYQWYKVAAKYKATYYGQMAALELPNQIAFHFPSKNNADQNNLINFIAENNLAKIAAYYLYLNQAEKSIDFLKKIIQGDNSEMIVRKAISLISYSNDYASINNITRFASRFNVITLDNYPIITQLNNNPKRDSLIMSIIKQESGFNKGAVSTAGAVGFMQLMPKTAKEMARRMKLTFNKRRLSTDATYNIKLGSYYINHLLKRFNNSYILAIASYNAGPNNTKKWIKDNGDPRMFKDKYEIIDWIEKISFSETRNYVQRILENLAIYSHLID
jgi:soluble lytic murein transglycosylase